MESREIILKDCLENIYKKDMKQLLQDEMYLDIRKGFNNKVKEYIASYSFKEMLYKAFQEKLDDFEKQDKTFKEVFPEGFENNLKVLVYNKSPEVIIMLKGLVNDIKFRNKIKSEMSKMLQGMNPMISKFVNIDKVYNQLIGALNSYIDSPETMMNIVNAINSKIDEGKDKNISEFTNYIPYQGKITLINSFVDSIIESMMKDEFIIKFENSVEQELMKHETIGNCLNSINISEDKFLELILKLSMK